MSEEDIDPGAPSGGASADQYDAMDAATQAINARRVQREIQETYRRDIKDKRSLACGCGNAGGHGFRISVASGHIFLPACT